MKTAAESGSGTAWSQTYAYDRYGNRRVTAGAAHGSNQALTPQSTADIAASTNRLAGTKGVNLTVAYDAAGNLKADWAGNAFKYDGDNRLVAFDAPMGTDSDTAYAYDGEGRRVRRVVGGSSGVTTTYVYNVLGQLVAEFGGTAPARPGTRYLTPDHLGSTRVVTGEDQSVLTRHDYLPFGEEIGAALGNRNQASGVSGYTASLADGPAQKFTGKERDNESGLDYFQARYFSGAGGRFTSADVPFADQGAADPQSWNLYSYTRNNPLVRVDPNGRFVFTLAAIAAALYVAADIVSTGVDVYTLYDTIQDPDATAGDISIAAGAVVLGTVAPGPGQAYVQGVKQGAKVVSKVAGAATDTVAGTRRAAHREAKRRAGIPVSQQASKQRQGKVRGKVKGKPGPHNFGRQQQFKVPKAGGGTETKVVNSARDTRGKHTRQKHIEAGRIKKSEVTDDANRLRIDNQDKVRVLY